MTKRSIPQTVYGTSAADKLDRYSMSASCGCVVWLGSTDGKGYGQVWDGSAKRRFQAHRVAWEAAHGPIPEGLEIDHLCRNRACINPDHLEPVTPSVNVRRGAAPAAVAAANAYRARKESAHV